MSTWLFTYNADLWNWESFDDDVKNSIKGGEPFTEPWRSASKQILPGDKCYLIKLGKEPRGIIACGFTSSESYIANRTDSHVEFGKNYVDISLTHIIDWRTSPIVSFDTLNKMFPEQKWNPQSSGISIKEEYTDLLNELWAKTYNDYCNSVTGKESKSVINQLHDKNMILYGPPGTGKTYRTIFYAVAIVENKTIDEVKSEDFEAVYLRYERYKEKGLIEFTTFHQSYGYEDFIEGIRPVIIHDEDNDKGEDSGDVKYEIHDGIFKEFCEKASNTLTNKADNEDDFIGINPTIWKISLEGAGDNETRTECMENNHIRIGWDQYGKDINEYTVFDIGGKSQLNAFIYKMKIGDVILSCYNATTIDAIGYVTGDYEWSGEYKYYNRLRKVKWVVKNIRENIVRINNGVTLTLSSVYKLNNISLSDVQEIINKYNRNNFAITNDNKQNYVFIIDEINRGNISKIFGELITLIEYTKRIGQPEETKITLPYSKKNFGVPDNVYILGTMNTADRSIALMDTALRRRFRFVEMMPKTDLLKNIVVKDGDISLSIADMLDIINKRIEFLYDREHTIGHAFFMQLKDEPTVEKLAVIFEKSIIPLLQEYFYEDYQKIQLVLGDNDKSDDDVKFIKDKKVSLKELFKGNVEDIVDEIEKTYEINEEAFKNINSYKTIAQNL